MYENVSNLYEFIMAFRFNFHSNIYRYILHDFAATTSIDTRLNYTEIEILAMMEYEYK